MKKANKKSSCKTVSGSKQLNKPEFLIALALLLFCTVHAVWCFSIGWDHTLNDHHSFRQSQNAIMAFYIKSQPFKLAFELPVLGKPWSIPTEFPLYDIFVADISKYFSLPLDQVGRAVCAAFFILALIPVYALLRVRNISISNALIVICLFLISPFYLFWSRTFMPESTALFFSFSYLACVMWGAKKNSWMLFAIGMFFGIFAGLSKVTTWLPVLAVAGLWLTQGCLTWPLRKLSKPNLLNLLSRLVLACGIPLFVALLWIKYSDHLKILNPLAINISSSSPQMSAWNYGTIAQKLSLQVWDTILSRVYTLFGLPEQAWLILACGVLATVVTRRRWKESSILLGVFLLSPTLFTNVHFIHDYYMNANGFFLLGAVGFAIVSLLESNSIRAKCCGWLFVMFVLFSGFCGYATLYQPLQEMPNDEILQLTDYIKKNTPDNSVLIILGADWNPLISYYSQRRSLMIPDWPELSKDQVQAALNNLKDEKIGALLVSEPHRYPLDELLQQANSIGLDFPILKFDQLPLH